VNFARRETGGGRPSHWAGGGCGHCLSRVPCLCLCISARGASVSGGKVRGRSPSSGGVSTSPLRRCQQACLTVRLSVLPALPLSHDASVGCRHHRARTLSAGGLRVVWRHAYGDDAARRLPGAGRLSSWPGGTGGDLFIRPSPPLHRAQNAAISAAMDRDAIPVTSHVLARWWRGGSQLLRRAMVAGGPTTPRCTGASALRKTFAARCWRSGARCRRLPPPPRHTVSPFAGREQASPPSCRF